MEKSPLGDEFGGSVEGSVHISVQQALSEPRLLWEYQLPLPQLKATPSNCQKGTVIDRAPTCHKVSV